MSETTNLTSTARTTLFSKLWNWLTEPSKFITDMAEQQSARLATSFLLTILTLNIIGGFSRIPRVGLIEAFISPLGISMVLLFIVYLISRLQWYRGAIFLFSLSFSALGYANMIADGNQADFGAQVLIYVPLSLIVASSFLSAPAVFLLVGLNVGAYFSIQTFGVTLPENIGAQTGIITIIGLVLILLSNFRSNLERIRLAEIQTTNQKLETLTAGLEQRVAERTKALETSAEVSRRLASILDPGQLTSAVVNEVRNAYNYYYAQIYLFDDSKENLVLAAGTGEAGEAMLKRGHSLPKGSGLVGQAAESNTPILVSDTSQAPNWLPNDLLPDTKAEAAIPITIGGQVLGVLDVQDDVTNDINSGDITLLTSLANQVAVSLNNARQYQQAQSLREQYALAVESSNDGIWDWDIANDSIFYSPRWKAMLGFEEHELTRGFVEWEDRIHPEDRDFATKSLDDYLAQRAPTYDVEVRLQHKDGTWRWVRDRGKALRNPDGSAYRMAGSHSDITERKHLEGLNAQRSRQQEAINIITQRIQSTTSVEAALQMAARELGHALGSQTSVRLNPTDGHEDSKSLASVGESTK